VPGGVGLFFSPIPVSKPRREKSLICVQFTNKIITAKAKKAKKERGKRVFLSISLAHAPEERGLSAFHIPNCIFLRNFENFS
jgi:hypothetical protein